MITIFKVCKTRVLRQSNSAMNEVVSSGITLVFVSFPTAIADMPGASFWAILFFFMVLLLGLDTQFTVVEICTTAVIDAFPGKFDTERRQALLKRVYDFVM